MKIEKISPIYLVPFDKKYFLLGLSLLANLKKYIHDFENVFVLDFGLTKNHLEFLEEFGVSVIPCSRELVGSHPFKLKSSLIVFLRNKKLLGRWVVLLDADMLVLRSPVDGIHSLILEMTKNKNKIAICKDMGDVKQFLIF